MRVREARMSDALAIARVHVDAWRATYPGMVPDRVLVKMSRAAHASNWAHIIARRNTRETILVAELGSRGIVGFGSCGPTDHSPLPHRGEVFTLYVAPDYQERGIGRALLSRLFDALLERGMGSAMVWVLASNPARFFYETMGGRRVAERDERLWDVVLHQAAYGWSDLKQIRARNDAGEE